MSKIERCTAEVRRADEARVLVALNREGEPLKAHEIASWESIPPARVRRALLRLNARGLAIQNPLGYWEVAQQP